MRHGVKSLVTWCSSNTSETHTHTNTYIQKFNRGKDWLDLANYIYMCGHHRKKHLTTGHSMFAKPAPRNGSLGEC